MAPGRRSRRRPAMEDSLACRRRVHLTHPVLLCIADRISLLSTPNEGAAPPLAEALVEPAPLPGMRWQRMK